MNTNPPISDQIVILDVIDPDAYTAGTVTSPWLDMSNFEVVMATVMAGSLGTNATLDAKLEQATDGAGTGAKDVTGKAITQLTQAGADDSDKQAIIELRSEEMDVNGGFTHVRLSVTVGTATSDAGAIVHGIGPRYQQPNDATVAEQVL
ncbi:MAG: hypothetical protein AAFX92_06210 [Pseudomonadota bacterium]